ncbi:MAG TPA: hypothetical protein VII69_09260, partial [Candidatus Eremiobacteraceae bacterium]
MIATLLLAAALLAPGAAPRPAYHPATAVARVMAVCSAFTAAGHVPRRSARIDRHPKAAVAVWL